MPASSHAARPERAARWPRLWLLSALILLGGCAATYMDVMQQVDQDLTRQQPEAALKALDKLSGGKDQTLYLLNKAMVLRMTGDYAGSVKVFARYSNGTPWSSARSRALATTGSPDGRAK